MAPPRSNRYFLPGDGIAREVITADICRYLGNDALVKPGAYEEQEGFWVTAYRALTSNMIADLKADTLRWQSERRDAGSRGAASVPYYKSQVHEDRQNYGPTPSNAQFPPPGTGQRNPNPNPNPYPYEDIRTPSSQGSYDPNYGQATSYGPQGTYQSQGYPPDYLPPQGQAETSSYIYTQGANYPVQSGQQPRTAPQYDYPQQMEQVPYPSPIENQNYSQQQPSHRPVPRGGHHSHPHPRDPNNRGGNYY